MATAGEQPGECPTCGKTEWKQLVSDGGACRSTEEEAQNQTDPQWGLQLDDTDERKFAHGATGYGVEVYGGTPEARETAFREQFDSQEVTGWVANRGYASPIVESQTLDG